MFILGIAIGDRFVLPLIVYAPFWGVLVLIGIFCIRKSLVSSFSIHLAVLITGAMFMSLAEQKVPSIAKGEHYYEAVVLSQPIVTENVYKFDLLVCGKGTSLKVKATLLRRSQQGDHILKVGDGLAFTTSLQPVLEVKTKEGKFDYRRWLRVHQYDAVAFVRHQWRCRQVDISSLSTMERLRIDATIYRSSLLEKYKQLSMEKRSLALVSAMTIGDKSFLDEKQLDDYSISGASHILALSGLHLAVLYAILNFVMNVIAKIVISFTGGGGRLIVNFVKTLLLLSLIWGFAFLAGLTPSITRATSMISLYALVDITNRGHQPFNTLALTAILILAYNPFFLWDVSFQLSFMAVLGIFFFQPKRKLNYLFSLLWISMSAQMAVVPLILYHFGRFSCYFLLTNIVVVPFANVILYSALVLLALSPFVYIQNLASNFLSLFAYLLDHWVRWISSLPGASIDNINFDIFQTIALYVIIVCMYRIICLTLYSK